MYGTLPLLPPTSPWIGVKTEGLLHFILSPKREYTELQIRPIPPTDLRGWPERSALVLRRRGKRGKRRRRWVVGVCRDWGMLGCESSSYAACVACWFNVVVVVCCGANVCVKWCAGLYRPTCCLPSNSSSSPSGINNKRGAMAPSTWGTFRFLLFFSIGFLVLGTMQGKVMAKKSAYMNNQQIFRVVICSWTEQLDRPYLRVVLSDPSRLMKTLHNVSRWRKYVNIYHISVNTVPTLVKRCLPAVLK